MRYSVKIELINNGQLASLLYPMLDKFTNLNGVYLIMPYMI